ncbi:archease [bacterium]|jgi:SHS2 domain-containing protein|nr:archease [bacterium]
MEDKKDFEFIEHTADIKVKIYGDTLKQLFQNGLVALFQTVLPKAKGCFIREGREFCSSFPIARKISVTSGTKETLLIDFLSEVLCLMDTYDEAYGEINIQILSDTELVGTLHGIPVASYRGEDVKAATYHELSIDKVGDTWEAIVTFDV